MYSCVLSCSFVNTQMKKVHHNTPVFKGRYIYIDKYSVHTQEITIRIIDSSVSLQDKNT